MKKPLPPTDDLAAFERAAEVLASAHYVLRLYVTSTTPNSMRALVNIREICEKHLQGRYELEVVDISKNPDLIETERIIAVPTLIKEVPLPLRRLIGDMSQTDRVLVGLDLREKGGPAPPTPNR